MSRRLLFLPLIALIAAAAGFGLMLGGRAATTTETEVIERVVAVYLSDAGVGAARSDCAARPAASADLWLVVACGPYEYFVDAYGRLVHVNAPEAAS
ncbi:MAG: hypothetical protein VR71_15975 [Roseovarius sp. BRH_c41]|jgi:hypothetical protein|uniref:hypothetical protein n=1 Tax=Roseovarius sp. BRH_c41 TaxID=1629709 RepID=UPI0005F22E6E|nr:hypothetical protein [Roseovarius sp. BRH_c41]KJS42158.1 MAG: hypothetical protein VR71_15975 [Roseovarius sp. BRH_c41]